MSKLKYQNFNFATRKCFFFSLYRTRDKQTVWQIKSNQIKSNQVKSGQVRSGQVRFAYPDVAHLRRKLFWTMETLGTNVKRKIISGRKIKSLTKPPNNGNPRCTLPAAQLLPNSEHGEGSVRVHQGRPTLRLLLESQLDIPGAELHEGNEFGARIDRVQHPSYQLQLIQLCVSFSAFHPLKHLAE